MILALDTVFEHCSVALVNVDGSLIAEQTLTGNRQQTQQILPMIEQLLQQTAISFADLTAIAFNRGPGAFSGIRIDTAVAQALAFAYDLPCLPVSSLQALAQTALSLHQLSNWDDRCYTVIDARMNQVYLGEFYAKAVTDPQLHANIPYVMTGKTDEQLVDYGYQTLDNLPIVGDGGQFLTIKATQTVLSYDDASRPTAGVIGQLGAVLLAQGEQVSAENALPVYLRHNAWKTLAEQGK